MKSDRQRQILEVSKGLFLHYGFQKVTLSDIAKELGVSRPTVYQAFPNKEEIFIGLLECFFAESLARIGEVRQSGEVLGKKLEEAIEIWVVEPFQLIHSSPGVGELMDCGFDFAQETMADGYAAFEAELAGVLDDAGFSGRLVNADLAQLLAVSLRGFKPLAKDVAELRGWISDLLTLILAT
ncbi:MAG: TetR/AcrR family transcriptional regulator [Verrucomicrobiota bacterium]